MLDENKIAENIYNLLGRSVFSNRPVEHILKAIDILADPGISKDSLPSELENDTFELKTRFDRAGLRDFSYTQVCGYRHPSVGNNKGNRLVKYWVGLDFRYSSFKGPIINVIRNYLERNDSLHIPIGKEVIKKLQSGFYDFSPRELYLLHDKKSGNVLEQLVNGKDKLYRIEDDTITRAIIKKLRRQKRDKK